MKRMVISMAGVSLVSLATGAWLVQGGLGDGAANLRNARTFEQVMDLVRDYYVDSIPEAQLYTEAAYGLVSQLNDPYSALLLDEDLDRAAERTSGNYGGIGARIDVRGGWVTVVSPMRDTPAERAGLQPGDRFIAVDGESARGWSLDQAVNTLRGEIGTEVTVTVNRAGRNDDFEVRLRRAEVHQRAVEGGVILDGDLGYVAMDMVRRNSATELAHEVGQLYARGISGLIIDLRGNPGGLRDEAVRAADLFLDPGSVILETRGRVPEDNRVFLDSIPQPWPDLPVVVLVDQGSVSAAEIIAGALQDHDRAVVVGQPSFGKGLVQTQFRFARNAALRITTARYLTPSGRSIQRSEVDIPHGVTGDSAGSAPAFYSASGRSLPDGDGIVPEVVAVLDTLTDGERRLAQELEPSIPGYRDALAAVALRLKESGEVTSRQFTVDSAMAGMFLRELRANGIELPPEVVEGGWSLMRDHLGYEVARYLFGPQAELERRLANDGQVRRAADLLKSAANTRELFELAGTPLGVAPAEELGG